LGGGRGSLKRYKTYGEWHRKIERGPMLRRGGLKRAQIEIGAQGDIEQTRIGKVGGFYILCAGGTLDGIRREGKCTLPRPFEGGESNKLEKKGKPKKEESVRERGGCWVQKGPQVKSIAEKAQILPGRNREPQRPLQ